MEKKQINITDAKEGQKVTVVSILGGQMAVKRLSDLGLTPQTEIKIVKKIPYRGPIEIEVRGSNIVVGRGLALKILVEPK
ncbi:ferrous iron transport protein A [bacterium]|nr:ferrous iron transport protein A [bacterium]